MRRDSIPARQGPTDGDGLPLLRWGLLAFCLALALAEAMGTAPAAGAQATVTLRPAAGAPGAPAAIEGAGFARRKPVAVRLSSRALARIRPGKSGSFKTSFRIPPGRGVVMIVSRSGRRRVLSFLRVSSVAAAADSGEVASQRGARIRWAWSRTGASSRLDLDGSGLPARRDVRIVAGSVPLHRGRTDRKGRFSTRAPLPSLVPGRYAVTVKAGDTALDFSLVVPPAPVPSKSPDLPVWTAPWLPIPPEEPLPLPLDPLPPIVPSLPPLPPPAPLFTGIDPASPANDNSPRVKGTSQAGSTVRLYTSADCSGKPAATGSAADFSSPGLTVSVADDSTTGLRAIAISAAGAASACSPGTISYTEDSTAPPAPTLSGVAPASPANDNSPRVKGTAQADSTVRLYAGASCSGTPAAIGTASEFSLPGLPVSVPNDSTTTFRATATDAAGNASPCSAASISYTEDSTPPPAPTLTATAPSSPANDNSPRVKGTAQAGSTIRLYASVDCSGTLAATGTAADLLSPGLSVAVPDNSTTSFRAIATDAAGNGSSCSASSITYVEDSIPPQPLFPIRAAFYYPWFPEAWNQNGINPFTKYNPSLGFYRSDEQAVRQSHLRSLQYAGFEAGIYSWWGQGHRTDQRFPAMLADTIATATPLKWALYHEREGNGPDPTVEQIGSDLDHIKASFASNPAYLKVGGKPVIFVYGAGGDGCPMADRWKQANTASRGFYVVLKVFAGYRTCANQPDAWHQYAPSSRTDRQGGYAFAISPEFDLTGPEPERLARDPVAFEQAARDMVASGEPWQLVISFNEWGENTATESAAEWATASGEGRYLDILAGL